MYLQPKPIDIEWRFSSLSDSIFRFFLFDEHEMTFIRSKALV